MMEYHLKDRKEVEDFIRNEVLTSSEVKEFLSITRQRLHALVNSERLKPVKRLKSESLFLRTDVEQLQKELKELRKKYRPYEAE
jgi:hypothetical protein